MLIVSQNKVSVLNFDNVNLIGTNRDGEIKARLGIDDNILLGTYETEERAKEVLNEIINKYRRYNIDANQAVTFIPKVYEMPKR